MIKFGLKSGPNYNFNKYRNQCNRKRMEANVTGNQQVQADVNGNQQVQANVNGNQQVQANVIVNQQANEIGDQEGDDVSVI